MWHEPRGKFTDEYNSEKFWKSVNIVLKLWANIKCHVFMVHDVQHSRSARVMDTGKIVRYFSDNC